jgi:hypothetical protein
VDQFYAAIWSLFTLRLTLVGDDNLSPGVDLVTIVEVYRAFALLLEREPYTDQLKLFVQHVENGASVYESIVNSAQFRQSVADQSAESFVAQLYLNLRGTVPDDAFFARNVAALEANDTVEARGQMAERFANSPEMTASLHSRDLEFSLWRTDAGVSETVFNLYAAFLNRTPDDAGFEHWTGLGPGGYTFGTIAEPRSTVDLVARFSASKEFASLGMLSNQEWAERIMTGLDPDVPQAQINAATDRIEGGVPRYGFAVNQILASDGEAAKAWVLEKGTDDVLMPGAGDSTLFGGLYSDVFVFAPEDRGTHRIRDFEAWDRIDLTAFDFANAAAARDAFVQVSNSVRLIDGDVTLLIARTDTTDLTEDMFLV